MYRIKKFAVAGGTFTAAMAIGFVMQNGDALAARMVAEETGPAMQVQQTGVAQADVSVLVPALPAPDLSESAALNLPVPSPDTILADGAYDVAAVELVDAPDSPFGVTSDAEPLGLTQSCVPDLVATPGPAATVSLSLDAPCAANAMATIHHQGMIFTVVTDAAGMAEFVAPALSETAVFIAELPTGTGAAVIVEVPDVVNYDRAVLQWQGETGLQIHAREFGVDYFEDGHVWAAAARDVTAAATGSGGFLMRLGTPALEGGMVAEVYTFPTGMTNRAGEIALTVEAEILASTCGRELTAQSIQISPGQEPQALDLTMTLPGCEAVGEYLVLKNMLQSVTLAAR